MEIYIAHLSKILNNVVPENLFIFGKMGTGKTMVTKVLTSQLEKEASSVGIKVKTVYIHCKTKTTNIAVMRCLNDSIGLQVSGYQMKTSNSFDVYFSKFCKLAKDYNGYLIIILDEVDNLTDPDILNIFARVKESGFLDRNVTLIGITNDVRFDESLDARTRSVLSQKDILFHPWVQSHQGTKPAMKKQSDTYRSSQFLGLLVSIFTVLFTSKFCDVENG